MEIIFGSSLYIVRITQYMNHSVHEPHMNHSVHKLLAHEKPHLDLTEMTSHCTEILHVELDSIVLSPCGKGKRVCDDKETTVNNIGTI